MKRRSLLAAGSSPTSGTTEKSKKAKIEQATSVNASDVLVEAGDEEGWIFVGKGKDKPSVQRDAASVNLFSGFYQGPSNLDGGQLTFKKKKVKKARKIEERLGSNPPRLFYVNNEITKRGQPVLISDIRELVIHLLGEASPQPWLKVENRSSIKRVVVLFVPGILPEHCGLEETQPKSATVNPNLPISIPLPKDTNSLLSVDPTFVKTLFHGPKEVVPESAQRPKKSQLSFIARTFSHACPTRAPGESFRMHSVLGAFFQGPITVDEKRRRSLASARAVNGVHVADPTRYILSPAQLVEHDYPLPSYLKESSGDLDANTSASEEDWVETAKPGEDENGIADIFAIDCEMCLTEDGKDLTRMCVIDCASEKVLLDRLVKPAKPIVDYLTRWSGITEDAMRNVTTTLTDVRKAFLDLMVASQARTGRVPILLGHSLESDLRALRLSHGRCIDTAVLYHHPRGRPLKPGLAWLTKKWCGREIQNRGESGHDAEEDARACIELLKRKLENGPSFGEFKTTTECESIFDRLRRSTRGSATGKPGSGEGAQLRTAVVDRGNPGTWHGNGATQVVACANDEEVTKGILHCLDDCDFIWARLSGLAEVQNWIQPKSSNEDTKSFAETDPETISAAIVALNVRLFLIHASLPARTALVVFTGHSDPRAMVAMQARKAAFEKALRAVLAAGAGDSVPEGVRWTTADARALEEAVEEARKGLLFLCMK